MATKTDIKQAVMDELVTVVTNNTSATAPEDHVGLLSERDELDTPYPFVGFETMGRPYDRGINGNVHVNEVVYTDGVIDHVVYQRDTTLVVDIGILSPDVRAKDDLYTAVQDRFSPYLAQPTNLHDDVSNVSDGGFSDASRGSDGVFGDRLTYEVTYSRLFTVDEFVPIEDIDFSIEDLDSDTVYDATTLTG